MNHQRNALMHSYVKPGYRNIPLTLFVGVYTGGGGTGMEFHNEVFQEVGMERNRHCKYMLIHSCAQTPTLQYTHTPFDTRITLLRGNRIFHQCMYMYMYYTD